MKSICTLLFYSTFGILLQAQTGNLSGKILDESNLPLPGAYIDLGDLSTVTDQSGNFRIQAIPVGSYDLQVSFIGFETMTISVNIEEGKTIEVVQSMQPGISLNEIVVTGQLRGQAKAINQQFRNDNITNVIASDQIGRFPDANIGDALKRVPGINVQYDQGEARFGNIRGTAPQYNSVTINGERIPSAEAEVRSIQLDLVPSDMIQTVEVNKAVTPDMDADAIGGSVNLVTRTAPSTERISATLGGGYNFLASEPTLNTSIIYGNRSANQKLGYILSASYFDNNLGSDNFEPEWTYDDANDNDRYDEGEDVWPEEFQIRQYYLQRVRQSYSLSLDYKFNNNHSIVLQGIYNDRKDWENRYRAVYKDIELDGDQWIGELERQTKGGTEDVKSARLEHQKMMSFSLRGDHNFGKLQINWSGAYSKANEDRPNERYYEIATDGTVPIIADLSDSRFPNFSAMETDFTGPSSAWELSEITEEFQYTEDVDFNSKLNFTLPLGLGEYKSLLKFGTRVRLKDKLRDNNFYEYEPVNDDVFNQGLNNLEDFTRSDFLAGDYLVGEFISADYLAGLDLTGSGFEQEQDLSGLAGNFDATEQIFGSYLMLDHEFSPKFKALVGVRVEQTQIDYSGFVYDDEEETLTATTEQENVYTNFLPGIHLRYNIGNSSVLRAAWTNTLARPNYFDLVPYRQIEEGEELSLGNPTLDATLSSNIDVMAEKYFANVGLVSGGVFFKSIDDFIVTQSFDDVEFDGQAWASLSQPINGGDATLFGVEFAFQRQLDFISESLKGVGLYFNYTFTQSDISNFNFEGREDEDLSLPGSPEHSLNASLSYDSKKLTARVSFNYASDFLDEVGSEAFGDRYYDQVTYLDFNLNYSINSNWVVYLNANNFLNQPLRYYQGIADRTMQAEYYGVRLDLGVKYDIFRQ